uniref:NADH dehydrogenase subunit 6 n=1 Tax=Acropyga pallida TaxID=602221 RepID=A0A6G5NI72_9HYME|nr:NADH dehydrogenase subunit 6 [Acropyga pallida]QBG38657.1 NADH dehydrogenase subunit 6 [Acropyga pallida]
MTKNLMIMNFMIIIMMFMFLFIIIMNIMNFNPIMMMINMIIYSMMICMKISMWKSNYLYSIIMFLIMISGLMIMFLYFSSLISNEQTKFKFNKLLLTNMIFNFMMIIILNYKLNFFHNSPKKFNFSEINLMMKLNEMNYQNILNLYEYPFNNLTIISMFYLMISLFSIIKICSIKTFTLRKIID